MIAKKEESSRTSKFEVFATKSKMVVIEPVTSTPKPSNSTAGDTVNTHVTDSGTGVKPTPAGYASDGYETATDTEVVDDETDKPNVVEIEDKLKDQTYEDALNDDELKQVRYFVLFKSRFL